MALTPEDVVKKEFTKPKGFGRSGYDEIQVDDFLDEIVVELRRLNTENEDLTGKLEDARRSSGFAGKSGDAALAGAASNVPAVTPVKGVADKSDASTSAADKTEAIPAAGAKSSRSAGSTDDAALAKVREELATAQRDLRSAKDEREKVQREVTQAQERLTALQKQIEQTESGSKGGASVGDKPTQGAEVPAGAPVASDSAAGVIALAQRLHDEHVLEGETTRDALIKEAREKHDTMVGEATTKRDELLTEGQAEHDALVGAGQNRHDELMRQANDRSTGLVKEAEERKERILGQLNTQREEISSGIQRLQTFEHEYRLKLKGYIERQLNDLNQDDDSAPKNPEGAPK